MSQQTSVETLGWSRADFVDRLAHRYIIRERSTNRLIKLGPAMARRKSQFKAMQDLLNDITRGGPVNKLWLKPRRSGRSTVMECLATDLAAFGGFNCGVISHDQEGTDTLFRMARTFWERLPLGERPELRRETTHMMEFGTKKRKARADDDGEPGELNTFDCRTAGGAHPFAGGTLHVVHGSEVAKWPGTEAKQDALIADALNAMAPDFPGIVVMEFTANGPRGWAYNQFVEAMKWKDRPGFYPWQAEFQAWFEDEGNRREVPEIVKKSWLEWNKEDLEVEAWLRQEFKVDQEQLWFRRQQIQKLGSSHKFRQDFPATWTEAFSASGNRVFEERHVRNQRENFVCPPKLRGNIISSYGDL